jgi:type I restriction-modification system DNA methylase subunit
MGYAESSCLKYGRDGFGAATLSAHHKKVLGELAPYAVYFVDDAPFVLFYEETADQEEQKGINKKIWNAQIPVTIVCGTGDVKVYSSCLIDREKAVLFDEVASFPAAQVDENSPFSYWEITNQNFWANYMKQFSGERLNDHLLRNLSDITKKLHETYHVSFATRLMLRLIFVRYLIDRDVDLDYKGFNSGVKASRDGLLELLSNKTELYKLFSHLKDRFNGNLFEMDNEINASCLSDEVFRALSDFFSASLDTKTGQYSLFDLYDFNIIPVELISNIYEILLGKEARDKDSAFYTPQYLVDYILDGSVSRFIRDNGVCKVLDPSCGSGIFLVESYRRMVEKELNGTPYSDDDTFLQSILSKNIYGVDLNKDAVDVAIFSLYLAVLDYKNPKTLKKFKLPNLKSENLFVADFFDEDALSPLKNKNISFDFIIGNPPWGSKKGLHVDYCKNRGYSKYMQNNDTCRAFILRSKCFCTSSTQCCFVLHSKMLYMQGGPSKRFREFLMTKTNISRIVELSSVRKLIFKNADAPAVILSYSFSDVEPLKNRFEYISMKPNLFFRLFNILLVEKTDIKYVQQKLLAEKDWAWKTLVYGFSVDIDIIAKTKTTFATLNASIKRQQPALVKGVGVQYNTGRMSAKHLLTRPLLVSHGAVKHFELNENFVLFEKTEIRRTSNADLFHGPYCLAMKGLDTSDYTMKAVYSERDFVFHEAVYAIKGVFEQKTFLLNVVGLLNSRLYAYFNLMLGSDIGVEREQRHMREVLTFPYIENDDVSQKVEQIQEMLRRDDFTVAPDVSSEIKNLNEMIFKAYNLADNPFIDYALNIQIPQLTNTENCVAYHAVNQQQLSDYVRPFLDALSAIYGVSDIFVTANVYPAVSKHYSAVEVVLCDKKPASEVQIMNDVSSAKTALTRFSAHKINDMFFESKDVIQFKDDSFYIIKPNYYKNWHPAIAQLDLTDVVDQILSRNGGNG